MANKIKRGDQVVVITGKDKGKTGRVLKVLPAAGRIVVEGVNVVKKHQKPSGDQPGQILNKEAALNISNVALWNETEGRRVKAGFIFDEDGKKVRVDKKTGTRLD
jgi:large subunit ribosomal protein L24